MWVWCIFVTPPARRGTVVQWGLIPAVPPTTCVGVYVFYADARAECRRLLNSRRELQLMVEMRSVWLSPPSVLPVATAAA